MPAMSELTQDETTEKAETGGNERKVLLLVDGSSYLYRAYHAMPDLRAVPGDPESPATGAIRGMINMLQKLRKDVRADYVACVFDAPGPTFRDALYPEYKANRQARPDDFAPQEARIIQLVEQGVVAAHQPARLLQALVLAGERGGHPDAEDRARGLRARHERGGAAGDVAQATPGERGA